MIKIFIISLLVFLNNKTLSNEIVKDIDGNFFILKKDGTYKKLPPPKIGNKYIIKRKIIKKELKKSLFKEPKKKARVRTNQGIR